LLKKELKKPKRDLTDLTAQTLNEPDASLEAQVLPVILSLTTDVRDIQAAQHGDADSGQIEPIQNANIQITSGKLT